MYGAHGMPGLDQFLKYFERDDVSELNLATGSVVTVRLNGALRPLTKGPLTSAHVAGLLGGSELEGAVPPTDTTGTNATFAHDGRAFQALIARRGEALGIRIQRATAAAPATRQPDPPPQQQADDWQALPDIQTDEQVISRPARVNTPPPMATPAPFIAPPPVAQVVRTPEPFIAPPPVAQVPPSEVHIPVAAPVRSGVIDPHLVAMLTEARRANASDVHIVAERPALIRRVGALEPHGKPLSAEVVRRMLMSLLDGPLEEALLTSGYADLAIELPGPGRIRANVNRQKTGLKGCFRLVANEPPTLESLGLPRELAKVASYHQGLAVISGPNGHGKTTTMAALIDLINSQKSAHIITVEDPIEVVHPRKKSVISQRQVGAHTDSFHTALKGALREDPDVICIGELRDTETVEMAMSAAETGHLVIATMSTPSASKTIDRMIDMFPPDEQSQVRATLAGALKIVVSQRLVPTADGRRMVAAAELITGNIPLWNLIKDNKLYQLPSLQQRGRSFGMIRIEDSLRDLMIAKVITEEVAMANAPDPKLVKPPPEPAPPSAPEPTAKRTMFSRPAPPKEG